VPTLSEQRTERSSVTQLDSKTGLSAASNAARQLAFLGLCAPIGPDNGATEQLGVLDVVATGAELITAAALIYLLRCEQLRNRRSLAPVWRRSFWSPVTRLVLALTAVSVPLLSVFASRS
jgi:formate-dependent nitrite reductase membrane component NrfD